jgi:uncharacterized cysteine cluster protein YcgN (CxxCxxCC family)
MKTPSDSSTKKTLHELAKKFPEKTYRKLEKYRDADRVEEAVGIGHNHPPDLVEVMAIENEKLKKRAQEAEGELSILKGIETNRVKEVQVRCNQLQDELDRCKRENNNLFTRIAELIEANEKEVKNLKWIKDHDYIFLVDENKHLRKELKELKEDNKKLAHEIDDRIARAREAGL